MVTSHPRQRLCGQWVARANFVMASCIARLSQFVEQTVSFFPVLGPSPRHGQERTVSIVPNVTVQQIEPAPMKSNELFRKRVTTTTIDVVERV